MKTSELLVVLRQADRTDRFVLSVLSGYSESEAEELGQEIRNRVVHHQRVQWWYGAGFAGVMMAMWIYQVQIALLDKVNLLFALLIATVAYWVLALLLCRSNMRESSRLLGFLGSADHPGLVPCQLELITYFSNDVHRLCVQPLSAVIQLAASGLIRRRSPLPDRARAETLRLLRWLRLFNSPTAEMIQLFNALHHYSLRQADAELMSHSTLTN